MPVSDRVRAEQRRLRRLATDAGLDDTELWYDACHEAREADRLDVTPITVMRRLLVERGVEHRAPDGFGTTARDERYA